MKKEVIDQFNLPSDKVKVIHNGITLEDFLSKSYLNKSTYALEEEKIVFSIGRLVHEKGFQTLIDAAPLVIDKYPNVKFVLAGKGYYQDELQEKINNLGLKDKFLFTGFITDEEKNSLFKMASASVFPSLYEPFGIVALEAMAAASPIIVSKVGGLEEIINHNIDGLMFEPNNPQSLADSILFLLENPYYAEGLGLKAFEKVQNLYTWNNIASQTEKVYLDVYKDYLNSPWGQKKRILVWSGFKCKEFDEKELEETNTFKKKEIIKKS